MLIRVIVLLSLSLSQHSLKFTEIHNKEKALQIRLCSKSLMCHKGFQLWHPIFISRKQVLLNTHTQSNNVTKRTISLLKLFCLEKKEGKREQQVIAKPLVPRVGALSVCCVDTVDSAQKLREGERASRTCQISRLEHWLLQS